MACFIALTGTAAALPGKNTVDSGDIRPASVKASDLAKNSVNSPKVAKDSLTGADIDESTLSAVSGPAGPTGALGPTGPTGPPGSDASLSSVAAGGDLTGFYPNPVVGIDKVGGLESLAGANDEIADGTIDAQDLADRTKTVLIGVQSFADPLTHGSIPAPTRNAATVDIPALTFSGSTDNGFSFVTNVPNDYVSGTVLEVVLDYSPSAASASGTDTVFWTSRFGTIDVGEPVALTGQSSTSQAVLHTAGVRVRSAISMGTTFAPGDLLLLTLRRETSFGTYPAAVALHAVGIRYVADR